jgi:hypothetical protein
MERKIMCSLNGYNPFKLAYIMLSSGLFAKCEFSSFNRNPQEHDEEYVMPRDLFMGNTITDKTVGNFANFVKSVWNQTETEFLCVCALNESDTERVSFAGNFSEDFIKDVDKALGKKIENLLIFHVSKENKHKPRKLLAKLEKKYKEQFPND